MTQRDRWAKRPVVLKYHDYKDALRDYITPESLPVPYHIHFIMAMPKSWSKKKKLAMDLTPHTQKPDKDNLEKGFLDAIMTEDEQVWDGRVTKWWGEEDKIIIQALDDALHPDEIEL